MFIWSRLRLKNCMIYWPSAAFSAIWRSIENTNFYLKVMLDCRIPAAGGFYKGRLKEQRKSWNVPAILRCFLISEDVQLFDLLCLIFITLRPDSANVHIVNAGLLAGSRISDFLESCNISKKDSLFKVWHNWANALEEKWRLHLVL